MQKFKKLFEVFRGILLSNNRKWEYAQFKEGEYWKKVKPYYMPWLLRLNRFGYSFGEFETYVNCIPLSDITSRFSYIKLPEESVIADIGCGPSGIGFSLAHNGKTYLIDPLLDYYKSINGYKENIFEKLDDSKILICSPGEEANIPEKVDLAFCVNVLDHVEDPLRLIANIYQTLKKNGYLFLMVNGYLNRKPYLIDPLHTHQFTDGALKLLLERNGFSIRYFDYKKYIHGERIQQLLIGVQNLMTKNKTLFCEFFVISQRVD